MKVLKIISIAILLVINSVDARARVAPEAQQAPVQQQPIPQPIPQQRPAQQAPRLQPQPAPTPIVKQPAVQQIRVQSYKDLVTYIKNARNVWDNANGLLTTNFVNNIVQIARSLRLDDFQIEALLQTARDIHGIFSGDRNRDIAILQAVNNQIAAAIR